MARALVHTITGPEVFFGPICNTASSPMSPGLTWKTFSNSPSLTFTPTTSGIYKVFASMPIFQANAAQEAYGRVFNTSGGATLLANTEGTIYASPYDNIIDSIYVQNLYRLTAGVTYTFDTQGSAAGGTIYLEAAANGSFRIFAEKVGS